MTGHHEFSEIVADPVGADWQTIDELNQLATQTSPEIVADLLGKIANPGVEIV